jgi:nucleoside-diphosphate-sugar epimerase
VVHAAAETGGGFDEHQRNSIDATRQLIAAMTRCGVRRMVYVSSISVLEPPRSWRERQNEQTALARDARRLGPYTWGKTVAEQLVSEAGSIEARIIRPGALIDLTYPELPGLAGRRLFGTWHLGLGRPALPIAVCDVERGGDVIAWCADQFDRAPARINLYDDAVSTRADLLDSFRQHGWRGRMVWVPISFIALMFKAVRTALALLHGRLPTPLSPWDILRPRWYDPAVSREVLTAAESADRPSRAAATPVSASV